MAYQSWSVVFGEQPSAAKWNILGSNDASFNDGTGFGDNIVLSRNLAPVLIQKVCSGAATTSGTTRLDVTGVTATFTPAIASTAIITGIFDVGSFTNAADVFTGALSVDAVEQTTVAPILVPTGGTRLNLVQFWALNLTAASHTLKLTVGRTSGVGTASAGTNSKMLIELRGQTNATLS